MTPTIRHAGDLDTNAAHALVWNVGDIGSRYQEIAVVGDRVVGSWTYDLHYERGRARIDSSRTDVTPRYRRKGVARALWFSAIRRWNPKSINATISTDEGRDFLARMLAEIAYRAPSTQLWVKTRKEDEGSWESHCDWAARELLRRLGEREQVKQPLKLLKGAAS